MESSDLRWEFQKMFGSHIVILEPAGPMCYCKAGTGRMFVIDDEVRGELDSLLKKSVRDEKNYLFPKVKDNELEDTPYDPDVIL